MTAYHLIASWLYIELAFWVYMRLHLYPRLNAPAKPADNPRGARGNLDMILHLLHKLYMVTIPWTISVCLGAVSCSS